MIYIFILRRRRLCEVRMKCERVRAYLSSVGPFVCIRVTAGEHTRGSWQVCLDDQRVSPFSPKLQTLYYLSTPTRKYEHASLPTYFLFMAGYGNLHTSGFIPVICWSSLRTEISVTLSTGNDLHSSPSSFNFLFPVKPLCWCYVATALNLLRLLDFRVSNERHCPQRECQ